MSTRLSRWFATSIAALAVSWGPCQSHGSVPTAAWRLSQATDTIPSASSLYERAIRAADQNSKNGRTIAQLKSYSESGSQTARGPDAANPSLQVEYWKRQLTIQHTQNWYSEWIEVGNVGIRQFAKNASYIKVLDREAGIAWVGTREPGNDMKYELLGRAETDRLAESSVVLTVLGVRPPNAGAKVSLWTEPLNVTTCWLVEESVAQGGRQIWFDQSDGTILRVRTPEIDKFFRGYSVDEIGIYRSSDTYLEYVSVPNGGEKDRSNPERASKKSPARETVHHHKSWAADAPFDESCFEIPKSLVSQLTGKAKEVFDRRQDDALRQSEARAAKLNAEKLEADKRLAAAEAQKQSRLNAAQTQVETALALNVPRGPAVKGVRLGEVLSGHPLADQLRLVPEQESFAKLIGGTTPFAALRVTINGRIKELWFPKATFQAESMPFEEFAQKIMKSYKLPSLNAVSKEHSYMGNEYSYVDAAGGWVIFVLPTGVVLRSVKPSAGVFD